MTPETTAPTYSLDVRSIGDAGPEVHRALRHVMDMPHTAIVARLYQAPSELLTGLTEEVGEQIAELLRTTGLDVALRPADQELTIGGPEFDVALHLGDPGQLPSVAQVVADFLGCELPKAAQLVWTNPAVLVGAVSQATVDVLRARLEPLGVELDISRPGEAVYDLYVDECAPSVRHRAVELLRRFGAEAQTEGPLLALGLDLATTKKATGALQSTSVPVRVLNRDFQRFDLRLDAAQDTPELRAALIEVTGMPERIVPRVLANLPLNLLQGVAAAEVPTLMGRFADLGAELSAHLVAFRFFDLSISKVTDVHATGALLQTFTGQPQEDWAPALLTPPVQIAGPFPLTRARWMAHELKQSGAAVQMNER